MATHMLHRINSSFGKQFFPSYVGNMYDSMYVWEARLHRLIELKLNPVCLSIDTGVVIRIKLIRCVEFDVNGCNVFRIMYAQMNIWKVYAQLSFKMLNVYKTTPNHGNNVL